MEEKRLRTDASNKCTGCSIPDNGDVEVTILGGLMSGEYFYGTDTVKIIGSGK